MWINIENIYACHSKYLSVDEVMQFIKCVYFYNFSYADVLLFELNIVFYHVSVRQLDTFYHLGICFLQ
jgi:hypothetical protein